MNAKSEFAEKLHAALKAAGFYYTGRIEVSEEEFNSFKDLSPKSMAEAYAKAHDLVEKSKIFYIFKKLYEDTQAGQKTFKLREHIIKEKMRQNEYMHAFQNTPELFRIEGSANATNRQYIWVKENKPVFSDVDVIYNFVTELTKLKLTNKVKDYIKENSEIGFDELNMTLNPSNEPKLAFKIRFYFNSVNSQKSQKSKPKAPITFDREISRSPKEIVVEVSQEKEEEKKSEGMFSFAEVEKRLMSSIESALLYQKLLNKSLEEYYKAKFDAQEKYIEALQEQMLLISKTGKS